MASAPLNKADDDEEDDDLIILTSGSDSDTASVETKCSDSNNEAAPLGVQEAVSWYGKKPDVLSSTLWEKNLLLLGQCKTVILNLEDYVKLGKTMQNYLKDCKFSVPADDRDSVKNNNSHKVPVTNVETSQVTDTMKNKDSRNNCKTSKNAPTLLTGAPAAKPKKATIPDFKKNKGLVGIKITHTIIKSQPDHQKNGLNKESQNVGPTLKNGSPITLLKSKGLVGTKIRKIMPLEAPAVQVSEKSTDSKEVHKLPDTVPVNLSENISTTHGPNKLTGSTEKQTKFSKYKGIKKTDNLKQKAHPGTNKQESKKNKSAKDSELGTANNHEHIRPNLNICPTVDTLVTEEMKKIIHSENTVPQHIKILLRSEGGENGSNYEIVLNSCIDMKTTKYVGEIKAETPTEFKKGDNEISKGSKPLKPTKTLCNQDLNGASRAPYDNSSKAKGAKLPHRKHTVNIGVPNNHLGIHYTNKTSLIKKPSLKQIQNIESEPSENFKGPTVIRVTKTNEMRSEVNRQSPGASVSNEPKTISLQNGYEDKSKATPQIESEPINKLSLKIQSVSQINSSYETNERHVAKPIEMPNFTLSDSAGVRIKEEIKEEVTGLENTFHKNIDNGENANVLHNKEPMDIVKEQPVAQVQPYQQPPLPQPLQQRGPPPQNIRASRPMVQPKLLNAVKQPLLEPPPPASEPRLNPQYRPPQIFSNANSAINQFRHYWIAPKSNMPRENPVLQHHDVHIPNKTQTQEVLQQQPLPKASYTMTQQHQNQRIHSPQSSLPNTNNVLLNQNTPKHSDNGPYLSASQLNQDKQRLYIVQNEQQLANNIPNHLNPHEQHCAALMKWNNYYNPVHYQQPIESGKDMAYWLNKESQHWSEVTHSQISPYLNKAQNQNAMPNQDTYAHQFYPDNSEYCQSFSHPSVNFTQQPPGMCGVNRPNTYQSYVSHDMSSTNSIPPSHYDPQAFAQITSDMNGASTFKCIKSGPTKHSQIVHHNHNSAQSSANNSIHPLKSNTCTNNAPHALKTVLLLSNTTSKNGSKRPGTLEKGNSAPKKIKPVLTLQAANNLLRQRHWRPVMPPLIPKPTSTQSRKISLDAYKQRDLAKPMNNRTIDYSVDNYKSFLVTDKGESSKGRKSVDQGYGSDTTSKL